MMMVDIGICFRNNMKCARLHLQERFKSKLKPESCNTDAKPLRYCQKRMINPEHEEDPRWNDIYARFHFHEDNVHSNDTIDGSGSSDSGQENPESEDLFLSVQTLKFQGNMEQPKRPRCRFKYKSPSDGAKHRMFVKQVISDDVEYSDDDRSSQLTCYYFDDYVKYLFNNDKSRPNSGKSSVVIESLRNKKDNKATQVDEQTGEGTKKSRQGNIQSKVKSLVNKCAEQDIKDEIISKDVDMEDTKITYRKTGRRKSLTISRTQSPETVQVIRVEVVCNQSRGSVTSHYEDNKPDCSISESMTNFGIESMDIQKSHFANKYLLTNTVKTLDENLSGGEKVTLCCKTFKLSERSQVPILIKPRTSLEAKLKCKSLKMSSPTKDYKIEFRK
ncbi:Uncharacterized protein OBRU01_02821 [Operophtera brumata]|uniref:Uncharacterized protein n=1 Tax=Operophtera brumata TaxID=104452 RepID=A0A0L7LQE9_OPEBR|nr:Uncharacterized protein OBRU01_02821 [Operophtera brumata]